MKEYIKPLVEEEIICNEDEICDLAELSGIDDPNAEKVSWHNL